MSKKLFEIESLRKKLDKVDLINANSYTISDLDINSFKNWCKVASNTNNQDKARNLLYYGFQPLYDLLVDNIINGDDRKKAILVLDEIINISTKFLSSYYIGEPDTSILKVGLSNISPLFDNLDGYTFFMKNRNIDINKIHSQNILNFIRDFLDCNLDGKVSSLDYFVGCACGSSEIVMSLSGITGTPLSFLRYSKRRRDNKVKMIKEQKSDIKKNILNKKVGVFEDFVCTRKSLMNVLNEVQKFSPYYNKGFSIMDSHEEENINKELNRSDFKVFSLK